MSPSRTLVAAGLCDRAFPASSRYLVIDYEQLYPIAPGLVLVKAPGHTPRQHIVLVNSHDAAWLGSLVSRGILKDDLDLGVH